PEQLKVETQTSYDPKSTELPNSIDRDLWNQFVDMRISIKKPLTANAVKLILKKLESYGVLANQSLENSIIGSYQGVYQPKPETHSNHFQNSNTPEEPGYFSQMFVDRQESNVIDVTPDDQNLPMAGGFYRE
ncbi:MarR family transcriptional regulator, partial [Acinetobacter sichuanensis]